MSAPVRSTGIAHGKLILAGEHFVVYHTPALALPLTARTVQVEVTFAPGPWDVANDDVAHHLRRALTVLNHDPNALSVRITANLPFGAGLGGSAALAVALVRALDADHTLSEHDVQQRAHQLEQLAHGNPSGIDDAVVAHSTAVRFVKDSPPQLLDVDLPPLWIALSGEYGSTRQAVADVAARAQERPEWFATLNAQAKDLVDRVHHTLTASDLPKLGGLLNENHALLQEVGVSTSTLDGLVVAARNAGAYGAKLTGAGLGGAVIALASPGLDLTDTWQRAGAVDIIAPSTP